MLKIFAYIWRRAADLFTAADILEWIGVKTIIGAVVSGIFTAIATSLSNAAWYYSLGLGLAMALVVLGVVIAVQGYRSTNNPADHSSKLTHKTDNDKKVEGGSRLPNGFIPLHEAVDKLHKAAKQGKIPMMGAETMSGGTWDNPGPGSEEDIFTWWAIRVAKDDDIEMRGRRPPGDMERIGKRVKKDFIFVDKATRLKDPMNDDVYYTDICIKRDALEASYYFSSGLHQD